MTTITLPEHLASTRLLAGITFTDGVATVESLGSHARRFLELTGANVSDAVLAQPLDAAPSAPTEAVEAPPAPARARKRKSPAPTETE